MQPSNLLLAKLERQKSKSAPWPDSTSRHEGKIGETSIILPQQRHSDNSTAGQSNPKKCLVEGIPPRTGGNCQVAVTRMPLETRTFPATYPTIARIKNGNKRKHVLMVVLPGYSHTLFCNALAGHVTVKIHTQKEKGKKRKDTTEVTLPSLSVCTLSSCTPYQCTGAIFLSINGNTSHLLLEN